MTGLPDNPHVRGYSVICGCKTIFIPFTCGARDPHACEYCRIRRSRQFLAKFYQRAEISGIDPKNGYMWTLGTSSKYVREYDWDAKQYYDNVSDVIEPWKLFRKRMNLEGAWSPLVYVVEAGSKGNRLHIHFLNEGVLSHKTVVRTWRSVTKEKSNVNYVKHSNIGYLAKYTSKSLIRYHWLGKLYKAKIPKHESFCAECEQKYALDRLPIYSDDVNTE